MSLPSNTQAYVSYVYLRQRKEKERKRSTESIKVDKTYFTIFTFLKDPFYDDNKRTLKLPLEFHLNCQINDYTDKIQFQFLEKLQNIRSQYSPTKTYARKSARTRDHVTERIANNNYREVAQYQSRKETSITRKYMYLCTYIYLHTCTWETKR